MAAVGAGTVVTTGKTPVDHVYSWVTGKDCSVVRKSRGYTYCIEDEVVTPVLVHCYPTLGEVTCYAVPDPFPGGQRELGSVPPPPVPLLAARQPPTAEPAPTTPTTPAAIPTATPMAPSAATVPAGAPVPGDTAGLGVPPAR